MIRPKHLKKDQFDAIREKLENDALRIQNNFQDKKGEFEVRDNSNKDDIDSANESIMISTTMRFSKRDNIYLKKINKSLKKIQQAEYGECEDCGADISYARLMARPTSELCINCKEEAERDESQNAVKKKSKSLGQEIHLR